MAAPNINYYPEGYVVIPREAYDELMDRLRNNPEMMALTEISTNQSTPLKTINEKQKSQKKPRGSIDEGKINALYNAGWKVPQIAEEMKCSQATVYNHIKKG